GHRAGRADAPAAGAHDRAGGLARLHSDGGGDRHGGGGPEAPGHRRRGWAVERNLPHAFCPARFVSAVRSTTSGTRTRGASYQGPAMKKRPVLYALLSPGLNI